MKNTVTFVTSYLKIYNSEYDESKTFEKRLNLFMKVVNLNINICLFTSPEFEHIFREISENHPNLKVLQIVNIEDSEFFQIGNQNKELLVLPNVRSEIKDHINYMFLMTAKIEYIKKTIDVNPFNNSIFCWFDFSMPYVFKNVDETLLKIKRLSSKNYINQPFLTMPGCWNYKMNDIHLLIDRISWRFCGNFFMGDSQSLTNFYNVSVSHFNEFLHLTKKLVWEVNYWAWLESRGYIDPIWYPADHNDTVINIPNSVIVNTLLQEANDILVYNYPNIDSDDKFFASSASYIYDKIRNKKILNTRYVNYYYKDNWDCDFFNNRRQIKTINVKSELNENFEPLDYNVMSVDEIDLYVNNNAFAVGLEDIRLYESNNDIKFLATNIHYNQCGKNRMIIGDYDYENSICKNLKIINMSFDSKCEKNWSPLPSNINNEQLFIYKWNPYTVGFVNNNNTFENYILCQYTDTIVNKFRGSTPFINYDEKYLIGIVHYSVPAVPPIYYHSLVLLNKTNFLPELYSEPFKFSNSPIEFCIGFTIEDDCFLFWISRMDREPVLLKININKIDIDKPIN
jgi:hypothetical protein